MVNQKKESVEEVKETIKNIQPDCVAVELDEKRADSIKNPSRYSQLDLIKVLKRIAFGFRSFKRFKARIMICKGLVKINTKKANAYAPAL